MTGRRAVVAAVGLAACGPTDAVPALFVPDTVSVRWEDAWNSDEDGMSTLVPVDVMAFDAASGSPLPERTVTVTPRWNNGWEDDEPAGVRFLAVDDVRWHANGDPEDPGLWWDARRDAFFELTGSFESGGFEPEGSVLTDSAGVARFYLLVDALPAEVPVTATLAGAEETFLLVPR